MAYIRQIEQSEATGELAEFYGRMIELAGGVPNIVKLSSLKLPAMQAAQDLYQSVLYHDSELTMVQKEMVAVVVSVINGCVYCFDHHGRSLSDLTADEALTRQVIADFRKTDVDELTMAMLEFADKLTRDPVAMTAADVEELRAVGLGDEAILDLVQLISYFNYTNRLATGLGVDPED